LLWSGVEEQILQIKAAALLNEEEPQKAKHNTLFFQSPSEFLFLPEILIGAVWEEPMYYRLGADRNEFFKNIEGFLPYSIFMQLAPNVDDADAKFMCRLIAAALNSIDSVTVKRAGLVCLDGGHLTVNHVAMDEVEQPRGKKFSLDYMLARRFYKDNETVWAQAQRTFGDAFE
jgi:hypothetical protein